MANEPKPPPNKPAAAPKPEARPVPVKQTFTKGDPSGTLRK